MYTILICNKLLLNNNILIFIFYKLLTNYCKYIENA